jgi:hypothetical protein
MRITLLWLPGFSSWQGTMEPFDSKKKKGPEAIIQEAIIEMLELKGWFVKATHGNLYQSGLPDLFATHQLYGPRWIEVKKPGFKGSKFTKAQLRDFPQFCSSGSAIWILTAATEEEYQKLFDDYNWWQYLSVFRV